MIFQILIHIQGVKLLRIKTGQEHSNYKKKIQRLHILLTLLHSFIDVIIICTEIISTEGCAEHIIVVINDQLKLISSHLVIIKSLPHSCLIIILTFICGISKDCADLYIRIQGLEYLIIIYQHRH